MKKILFLFLLACLTITVGAQDARQRNTATIVADGLAQLPAQTLKAYNNTIQEIGRAHV